MTMVNYQRPFAGSPLIGVAYFNCDCLLAGQPAGHGSLADAPILSPGDADERINALGLVDLEDFDFKREHEQSETAPGLRLRYVYQHRPVFRDLNPRDTSADESVKLAGI